MLIPQIDRFTDHETIDCGALPVYDTVTFTADCVDAGMRTDSPRVLVLDGDNVNTLSVARELSEDLDATIIGVGTAPYSRLLRSNYCDVGATAPAPTDDGYADSVLRLLIQYRPDVVLPISYESVAMLDAIRTDLPDHVSLPIPRSESLDTAKDKHAALAAGGRIGVDTRRNTRGPSTTVTTLGGLMMVSTTFSFRYFSKHARSQEERRRRS